MSARTYDELFEQTTWHLSLERESERHWIVVDALNPDAPMIRTPSWETAVRFMEAFVARTPGASMEALHSWRAAQDAVRVPRPVNVIPLFHDHLDETA